MLSIYLSRAWYSDEVVEIYLQISSFYKLQHIWNGFSHKKSVSWNKIELELQSRITHYCICNLKQLRFVESTLSDCVIVCEWKLETQITDTKYGHNN